MSRVLLNLSTLSSRSFTIELHGKVHRKAIKLTYSGYSMSWVLLNPSTLSSRSFTIEFHLKVDMKAI